MRGSCAIGNPVSQKMAQRDDLTDASITDKMTGGSTHGSFPMAFLVWLSSEC